MARLGTLICIYMVVAASAVGVGSVSARDDAKTAQASEKARSKAGDEASDTTSTKTVRKSTGKVPSGDGQEDPEATKGDEATDPDELAQEDDEIVPVPACETKLRLSGTIYNPSAPGRSMAMLHSADDKRGAVYRAGAFVSSFEVMSVLPRGILLRGEQGECVLRLKGDPNKRVQPPKRKKRKRKGRKR